MKLWMRAKGLYLPKSPCQIYVVVGTGGVGKTTSSVAVGMALAGRGQKVVVLSIDPARRLADAVGMKFDGALHPLCTMENGGTLQGCMIDVQEILHGMIRRVITDEEERKKIFANQLLKSLTQRLGGLVEFVSLYKLFELLALDFDAVVLDTAPDLHAVDFLAKPGILKGFLENKVMTLLVKPLKLLDSARESRLGGLAQSMSKGLVELAGFDTLRRVVDFISSLEKVIVTLHRSGIHLDKLLRGPDAHFIAVTAPDEAQLVSLDLLLTVVKKAGFILESIVINRCPDRDIVSDLANLKDPLPLSVRRVAAQQVRGSKTVEKLVGVSSNFLKDKSKVILVPEQSQSLLTIDDYLKFSEHFESL